MLGCQQAATDHGRAAVRRRDGGDASVMKSVNPGSRWWSVSGQRNPVGGSRVASTCKRWARQPCLCFQLLAPSDDRRTRRGECSCCILEKFK